MKKIHLPKKALVAALLVFIAGASLYAGYVKFQENKKQSTEAMLEIQSKLSELQNYKDEQISLAEEKTKQQEAEAAQNEADSKIKKCNEFKDYCGERISNLKTDIQDQKNNLAERNKQFKEDKKEANNDSAVNTLLDKALKTEKESIVVAAEKALSQAQHNLSSLLNGECKNYQNIVCE
jgi:hypothetical protein